MANYGIPTSPWLRMPKPLRPVWLEVFCCATDRWTVQCSTVMFRQLKYCSFLLKYWMTTVFLILLLSSKASRNAHVHHCPSIRFLASCDACRWWGGTASALLNWFPTGITIRAEKLEPPVEGAIPNITRRLSWMCPCLDVIFAQAPRLLGIVNAYHCLFHT